MGCTNTFCVCVSLFVCISIAFGDSDCTLMITGVVGHTFSINKVLNTVELYACKQIDHLGDWVVRYTARDLDPNQAGNGKQLGLSGSAAAGDFIYVNVWTDITEVNGFTDFFGAHPLLAIPFNMVDTGREYIELLKNGVVVDRYGDMQTTDWIYPNGWAKRKDGNMPSVTYLSSQWMMGNLAGKTLHMTNGEGAFPKGTFGTTARTVTCGMSVLDFMHTDVAA